MNWMVTDKNLRIFIGPCWFGKIASTLASVFKAKGIKVTFAIDRELKPMYTDVKYDVFVDFMSLNRLQKIIKDICLKFFPRGLALFFLGLAKPVTMVKYAYYLPKFFLQHDAFIFLSSTSLLPFNLDLPILKLFRKKTVMWFIGSDIRHYESLEEAVKKAGIKYYKSKDKGAGPEALKRKLRMIHRVEKYVDFIISSPTISQLLTRRYFRLYAPIDIDNIRYNNVPNPRPVVVHATTNDRAKGTSYIEETVEQLKKEGYDFDFYLFRGTPNAKVRETLSSADVSVVSLFSQGPGIFALESMAAGCAVLSGSYPEFGGFPRELPAIHTDPDNVYQNLKMLLENPELRRELGKKGRKYVEKYHDAPKVASDILRLLEGNTENLISYNPQDS